MAAAEILAIGTGVSNSSDVTVAAGSSLTVAIKDAAGPGANGRVLIQLKADSGLYFTVGELTGAAAIVIAGAGVFRFSRVDDGYSCGVFSG